MFRLDVQAPEIDLPPHIIDSNYNEYPFVDQAPRLERRGATELFVTPRSEQAELIGEANTLQANIMDNSLRRINDKLKPPTGPGGEESSLPFAQRLQLEAEKLELETKISILANMGARLRGGIPSIESKKGIQTQAVLGAISVHQEVAQKAELNQAGEVKFSGLEVLIITSNLEVSAADLRKQAKQQENMAARATDELAKIKHDDKAAVLNRRAEDMLKLYANLLLQRAA